MKMIALKAHALAWRKKNTSILNNLLTSSPISSI
jgi:hypothetical protein